MPDPISVQPAAVVPRSHVSVGVEPALRQALAGLANGRVLVVDYFASRRCSVTIGDTMAAFEAAPPGGGYIELASIEGVRVFVEARLLPVLSDAGPTLHLAGPPFARHLSVRLEQPERWIEFLEAPGVLAGKHPFRSSRFGQGLR